MRKAADLSAKGASSPPRPTANHGVSSINPRNTVSSCTSTALRRNGRIAPVLSVTKFKTIDGAIEIGNDTIYGLGAGVWSRNVNNTYRVGRAIQAGRVWTNCYHVYPAHAAFGGYKQSGFGRETHKLILDHYQQTKNLLVSYSTKAMGFF